MLEERWGWWDSNGVIGGLGDWGRGEGLGIRREGGSTGGYGNWDSAMRCNAVESVC